MKRGAKLGVGMAVVLALGAAALLVKNSRADGTAKAANTVTVKRGEVVQKALGVGKIEPLVEISVKSQISGVVQQAYADAGDFVKAGSPLLEIKPNPTPLELVEGKREVEVREIDLANLEKDIARKQTLKQQGLVSDQEFDATQQRFAQAKLQVQMARERLSLLEDGKVKIANDQIETVIKAPISGYVLEKMVQIGDPVVPLTPYQQGTALMTMSEMKNLLFRGAVDEIDVGRLREGMPVEIKIGALPQSRVRGVLSKISLKAKTQENSSTVFPVEVKLTDLGGTVLRAGYSANAEVIIQRHDGVLNIPERVVTVSGDTSRVTVLLPNGKTEIRTIQTGLSDAITIEVREGLSEGELVVEKPPREIK